MPRCDLENHGKACMEMYRRAQAREGHPCNGCKTGKERVERDTIPPSGDTNIPKKETPVATDKKDLIFKRIENEKRCTKSRLMNFCGATADQVAEATKALEAEGKIKTHPGIREGAVIYTLPGIPKNYEAPSNDATVPSKPPRRVNRKAARTTREPVAHNRKAGAPSNGSGTVAGAIAELEVRRTMALDQVEKLDRALETLRALA